MATDSKIIKADVNAAAEAFKEVLAGHFARTGANWNDSAIQNAAGMIDSAVAEVFNHLDHII